ncbi:glycoside hydrolase family 6 protein [Isoptericola jiangsuensis]|uniref:glycoside hydrolase family 6 protein n=1 Tax=Isoptericola jiangsuensis TaxID=548579 RepID=UPI003AAE8D90
MRSRSLRPRDGAAVRPLAVAATLALAAVPVTVAATSANAAERVDNPYVGADQYVNEFWSDNVVEAAAEAGGELGEQMLAIADTPTSVWMDRTSAIEGNADGPGLRYHLDAALEQQQGDTPMVFNLVIYNLPGRDCFALASNGLIPATPAGLQQYEDEYVDVIADILAEPQYEDLRVVATIEPDSLPNMVTNSSHGPCQVAAPYYREGIAYTLEKLYEVGNVYSYIDAAHSGWLGWENNAQGAAQEFHDVIMDNAYGYDAVAGFVTNTANTTPTEEPFLEDENFTSGTFVRQSSFYEWNPHFDELSWTADLHARMVAQGAPERIGMLIDTSRNGWGGPARPTAESTSTSLNTYVDESRADRRNHRGAWCNPDGAGIGERPTVTPSVSPESHLHAFVWVKPPGESDGNSEEIPNDQGKGFDRMCDPTYSDSVRLGGNLTGALSGAPVAGQWFQDQFEMLVANAYPAIEGGTPPPADTTAPTAPGAVTAGTATSSSVALTWGASTDAVGVTGYTVLVDGEPAGTSATTSYTVTGLSPETSYEVTVTARDRAGNVSAASAATTITTLAGGSGEDTEAPSVPAGLAAGTVTDSSVALSWNASSDDTGVAGYRVLRDGEVVAEVAGTSATDTGLDADTEYSYSVVAFDAAGNASAASAAVSVTTEGGDVTPGGACTVDYSANSWNSGFTGSITLTNDSGAALNGWELEFSFANGQKVTQGWSAQYAQTGSTVTVTPAAWSSSIPAGGSVSFGFNATHSGTNNDPSAFTLDGVACDVA